MKQLVFLILFIPCIILLNNVINQIISNKYASQLYTNQYPYEWVKQLKVKPKIILVGSSTTKTGISAKELQEALGLRDGEVINLATMPNDPEITYSLVSKYIDRFADDAVILYGIDPENVTELYYQNFNIMLSQWSFAERLRFIETRNPDFPTTMNIVNGGNVFLNIDETLSDNTRDTSTNDYGSLVWKGAENAQVPVSKWFDIPSFEVSHRFLHSISKLDDLVYQKNRKMIVYFPSYSSHFMKQYELLNCHKYIKSQLQKAIRKNHFESDLSTLPDSNFVDLVHLSQNGRKANLPRILGLIREYGFRSRHYKCN